jgi:hypothetical protein
MIDRGKGRADPSPEKGREARYEATLHRGERHVNLKEVPALDLDRVPGAAGEVRVLISLEDAARLVEMGFEVRLLRAHPTRPLDAALIPEDDAAQGWLEERVRGIERKGGS